MKTKTLCPVCKSEYGRIMCFESDLLKMPQSVHIVLCKCGLIRVSDVSAYQAKLDYDRLHEKWESFTGKSIFEHKAKKYESFIKEHKPGKMLDFGCGNGEVMSYFKDNGWKVSGTEISRDAVDFCSGRGLNVFKGDLLEYDVEGGYDLIIAEHVIEHLPDVYPYFLKIYSLLRTGGKLILKTPYEFRGNCYRYYRYLKKGVLQETYIVNAGHIVFFTPRVLKRVLKETGFKIEYLKVNTNPVGRNYFITFVRRVFKLYRDIPEIEIQAVK